MPVNQFRFVYRRPRAVVNGILVGVLFVAWFVAGCLGPKRIGDKSGGLSSLPTFVAGEPVIVRIAMGEDLGRQALTCGGPWRLSSGPGDEAVIALSAGDTVWVEAVAGAVTYNHRTGTGERPWLAATPIDPHHHAIWDGRPWRGEFQLLATPAGHGLTVINVLEMEEYLAGVVPREIGNGRGAEDLGAIAAQAVAARTYAATRLGSRSDRGFDLYADTRDQAYGGVAWEDTLCNEALAATAHLVLRRGDELAATYYHSTCGGHGASIDEVWPYAADPLLEARADRRPGGKPWCAASRYLQWTQRWTWDQLEEVLARTLPVYVEYVADPGRAVWGRDVFVPAAAGAVAAAPGKLLDLAVTARTSSGRVAVLTITTSAGVYRVRGDRTRWVLRPPAGGPALLRSSWFEIDVDRGQELVVQGRGWGHGLGLCQMGALARSRAGQGFRDILGHYYRGARLAPLAGTVVP